MVCASQLHSIFFIYLTFVLVVLAFESDRCLDRPLELDWWRRKMPRPDGLMRSTLGRRSASSSSSVHSPFSSSAPSESMLRFSFVILLKVVSSSLFPFRNHHHHDIVLRSSGHWAHTR